MATLKRTSLYSLLVSIVFLTAYNSPLFAANVDELLKQSEPPAGVVFEIASGSNDKLRQLIPLAQSHIKKLRQRFPELDIAIVTHGKEQFSLTSDNKEKYKDVHRGIKSLVKDAKVPVHVCETYASWNNVEASAFPDYVDVAAAGPAQINDYRKLGYILIQLD